MTFREADLLSDLPLADAAADFALDAYVSCHFLKNSERAQFLSAVRRVLRPGGLFLTVHVSVTDQYYQPFARKTPEGHYLATDPKNGITKRLPATLLELEDEYGGGFTLEEAAVLRFSDVVLGADYRKTSYYALFRKD